MQAGQTLIGTNGKQVLLFPADVLLITQVSGPSSLSHCCGHPIDICGTHSTYPLYAPCDCHLVYSDSIGNTRGFMSDDEVNYATGVGFVCFSFTHAYNPPAKTSFRQGELIYYTGTAGYASGDHCHLDQAIGGTGQLVGYGITCAYGNACYAIDNSTAPQDMWFINDTTVMQTLGLNFQTYEGGIPGPTPGQKSKGMNIGMYLQPAYKIIK